MTLISFFQIDDRFIEKKIFFAFAKLLLESAISLRILAWWRYYTSREFPADFFSFSFYILSLFYILASSLKLSTFASAKGAHPVVFAKYEGVFVNMNSDIKSARGSGEQLKYPLLLIASGEPSEVKADLSVGIAAAPGGRVLGSLFRFEIGGGDETCRLKWFLHLLDFNFIIIANNKFYLRSPNMEIKLNGQQVSQNISLELVFLVPHLHLPLIRSVLSSFVHGLWIPSAIALLADLYISPRSIPAVGVAVVIVGVVAVAFPACPWKDCRNPSYKGSFPCQKDFPYIGWVVD